jgi:hypothetical protein
MKPRFSIRDIVWATLAVALVLMWWIDHRRLASKNRFTVEATRASDGEPVVLRDNQRPDTWLVRTAEGWVTSGLPGQPPPVFKPEE